MIETYIGREKNKVGDSKRDDKWVDMEMDRLKETMIAVFCNI